METQLTPDDLNDIAYNAVENVVGKCPSEIRGTDAEDIFRERDERLFLVACRSFDTAESGNELTHAENAVRAALQDEHAENANA